MVATMLQVIIALFVLANIFALPTIMPPRAMKRSVEENPGAFEGDMFFEPTRERGLASRPASSRWVSGIVPYVFLPGYTPDEEALIVGAMRRLERETAINDTRCVQFRPQVAGDSLYIRITNGVGCWSNIGQPSTPTFNHTVNLNNTGCLDDGRMMHELMHTLGFYHEQSRPDRDSYVRVYFQNIDPSEQFNFEKLNITDVDTLGTPYDFSSLMHYEPTAFSINGMDTIEAIPPFTKIGQRYYLSAIDIEEVRIYYNCTASGTTLPPTTTAITTTTTNPTIISSVYASALTNTSLTYARENGAPSTFYYESLQITIPGPGNYTIESSSAIDTYGYFYTGNFDPTNTSAHLYLQDDDDANYAQFLFRINFGSSYVFTLVVTTFSPGVTGPYSVILNGPATATFAVVTATTVSTTTISTTTDTSTTTTTLGTTTTDTSATTTNPTTSTTGPTTMTTTGSSTSSATTPVTGTSTGSSTPIPTTPVTDTSTGSSTPTPVTGTSTGSSTSIPTTSAIGTSTGSSTPTPVTGTPTSSSTSIPTTPVTGTSTGSSTLTPVTGSSTSSTIPIPTTSVTGTPTSSSTPTPVTGTSTGSSTPTPVTGTSTGSSTSIPTTPVTDTSTGSSTLTPVTGSSTSSTIPIPTTSVTGTPTSSSTPTPVTGTSTGSSTPTPVTGTSTGSSTSIPATSASGTSTGSSTPTPVTGTPTSSSTSIPTTPVTGTSTGSTTPIPTTSVTGTSTGSTTPISTTSATGTSTGSSTPTPVTGSSTSSTIPIPTTSASGTPTSSSTPTPVTGTSIGSSISTPTTPVTGTSTGSSISTPVTGTSTSSSTSSATITTTAVTTSTSTGTGTSSSTTSSTSSSSSTVTSTGTTATSTVTTTTTGTSITTASPTTTTSVYRVPFALTLSITSLLFQRIGGASSNYYYSIRQVTITVSGYYTFSTATSFSSYCYLYSGTFDPSNPSTNLVTQSFNQGGGSEIVQFVTYLQANGQPGKRALSKRATQQYSVLVTTQDERVTGSFSVSVSGPSSATLTDTATTTTAATVTSTAAVTVSSATTSANTGNSGSDGGSNAGVIAGAVVGGVVGLLCLCGICGVIIAALVFLCIGGRLQSNQAYVRSGLRMQNGMGSAVFRSGPFLGYSAMDKGWTGSHTMTLTFHPQAGHVIHGRGRDQLGVFVASGVYSPRTLRMGFEKIYQGNLARGVTQGRRDTVQVKWNSETRSFQGTSYSTAGGRRQAQAFTLRQAAPHPPQC